MAGNLRAGFALQPGMRVGIAMTNCVEFQEALFGAWMAGMTAVPINAKLHAREAPDRGRELEQWGAGGAAAPLLRARFPMESKTRS